MEQFYLRLFDNNSFGFVNDSIHEILERDISITNEDHKIFFDLQSQGKQFRLKEIPTGTGLFDYLETYIPERVSEEPGIEEFMLDTDYRLSKLELGV
jgi:hypothetical protein